LLAELFTTTLQPQLINRTSGKHWL